MPPRKHRLRREHAVEEIQVMPADDRRALIARGANHGRDAIEQFLHEQNAPRAGTVEALEAEAQAQARAESRAMRAGPPLERCESIRDAIMAADHGRRGAVTLRSLTAATGSGGNLTDSESASLAAGIPASLGFLNAGVPIVPGPKEGNQAFDLLALAVNGDVADLATWNATEASASTDQTTSAGAELVTQTVVPAEVSAYFRVTRKLSLQSEAPAMIEQMAIAAILGRAERRIAAVLEADTRISNASASNGSPTLAQIAKLLDSPMADHINVRVVGGEAVAEKLLQTPIKTSSDRYLAGSLGRVLGAPLHKSAALKPGFPSGAVAWDTSAASSGDYRFNGPTLYKFSSAMTTPPATPAPDSDSEYAASTDRVASLFAGDWLNGVELIEWEAPHVMINPYSAMQNREIRVAAFATLGIRVCRPERLARLTAVKVR